MTDEVRAVLEAYIRVASTSGLEGSKRSAVFVRTIAEELQHLFKSDPSVAVFGGGVNTHPDLFQSVRKELLVDVQVVTFRNQKAPKHGVLLPIITQPILQLECELPQGNDYRKISTDFNKLVCGGAKLKIMVLPLPDKGLDDAHLAFLNVIAAHVNGDLFVVAIPLYRHWGRQNPPRPEVYSKGPTDMLVLTTSSQGIHCQHE